MDRRSAARHDGRDQGAPQPDVQGGSGWRNTYYPIRSRDGVLAHLAYNAVANGMHRAERLDGWADLPRAAAAMDVRGVTCDGDVAFIPADDTPPVSWLLTP